MGEASRRGGCFDPLNICAVRENERGNTFNKETMKKIIRVGIIGLGGFAGSHHAAVQNLEAEGECRLVCTCDPAPDKFADKMKKFQFAERGVKVSAHYCDMLDTHGRDLDMVVIPTPVPLHAEMHQACVERGLPVYLEKPPTLDIAELEAMLAVEARAVRQTQVGFNYIVETVCQTLKRRVLAGEFGPVREVRLLGLWPRAITYYTRAAWAGRLMMNGRLVLDFCMGNALAHYVHNLLFWAGDHSLFSWAEVQAVRSELYRAHAIEGADTVFVEAQLSQGKRFRAAASHACSGSAQTEEWIVCDQATVIRTQTQGARIEWHDGRVETLAPDTRNLLMENHRAYYDYLRGVTDRPLTRLADTRPFVQLCDLTFIAAQSIAPVPSVEVTRSRISTTQAGQSEEYVAIAGIEAAARAFITRGQWPSAAGVSWARPGGSATPNDLPQLSAVVKAMMVAPSA